MSNIKTQKNSDYNRRGRAKKIADNIDRIQEKIDGLKPSIECVSHTTKEGELLAFINSVNLALEKINLRIDELAFAILTLERAGDNRTGAIGAHNQLVNSVENLGNSVCNFAESVGEFVE
ncbi:MAG TPA: hypothetical protein DDZ60_03850 [Planktothrix sp. UBA10369]|jgi:hypothetical protein|nr:hypothetical protein [Microcoleaceae cyanobacterium UBA11344]HBK21655.1 hypothetical protein [Planktothrix sp. UBA10369]